MWTWLRSIISGAGSVLSIICMNSKYLIIYQCALPLSSYTHHTAAENHKTPPLPLPSIKLFTDTSDLIDRTHTRLEITYFWTRCLPGSESKRPKAKCFLVPAKHRVQMCNSCMGMGSCFYPMTCIFYKQGCQMFKTQWQASCVEFAHFHKPHFSIRTKLSSIYGYILTREPR